LETTYIINSLAQEVLRARKYRELIHQNAGDKGKERNYREPIHQNIGDKGKERKTTADPTKAKANTPKCR